MKGPELLVSLTGYILLLDFLTFANSSLHNEDQPKSLPKINEEVIYKALFRQKRNEQLEAVKAISALDGFEKQFKMVNVLLKKVFEVTLKNKLTLEGSDYIPGSTFPKDDSIKEALSQTLENTAFFGDIVLRLPDIAHTLLDKNKDWRILAQWSIGFSNSTELFDSKTVQMITLVAQELELIPKSPFFVNPYRQNFQGEERQIVVNPASPKEKEKKRTRKLTRGPRLGGARHSEL